MHLCTFFRVAYQNVIKIGILCALIIAFSARAEEGKSSICSALMHNLSNPMLEGAKTEPEIYSRVFFRELIQGRPKIAVLPTGVYTPELDRELKTLGYAGVAIRSPSDQEVANQIDFILAPEKIRFVMPAPASVADWIAGIGSSNARNQLKRKLAASTQEGAVVRTEFAPLNLADYDLWQRTLFVPEVLSKEGAVPVWKEVHAFADAQKITIVDEKALSSYLVPNMSRVFFYSASGELIGGSLISLDEDTKTLRVRAAAFEAESRSKYELAIRGVAVLIEAARARDFKYISYGDDYNFYGLDMTHGLHQFKSSLGMAPTLSPTGQMQLIKIFDSFHDVLGAEYDSDRYQGIFLYGVPGTSMRRVEAYHALQRSNGLESYRQRLDLFRENVAGVQVGADPGAPRVKLPAGFGLE